MELPGISQTQTHFEKERGQLQSGEIKVVRNAQEGNCGRAAWLAQTGGIKWIRAKREVHLRGKLLPSRPFLPEGA
jgi:hypothetical protein